MPLRLVFMGTPDFSVPTLRALHAAGHDIAAVYTRAPQPKGRGMDLQPTPVERAARELDFKVLTPKTLKTVEAQSEFAAHGADAAVVVAYGLILPQPVLDAPKFGCFNLHASLLPRWRGAAPINRAIMAGDAQSGVMVMKMDIGLDTGAVAATARVAIEQDMTAGELHDALASAGAPLMTEAMSKLEQGALNFTPQPVEGVTYAAKIDKNETRIDFSKSARDVHNHCHGLSPFPGAWFEVPSASGPLRIKVLRTHLASGKGNPGTALDDNFTISCGEGAIRIVELQRAGGKPMKADEFLRGVKVPAGTRVS